MLEKLWIPLPFIASDRAMVDEALQNSRTYKDLCVILLMIKDETLLANTYRISRMRMPVTSP